MKRYPNIIVVTDPLTGLSSIVPKLASGASIEYEQSYGALLRVILQTQAANNNIAYVKTTHLKKRRDIGFQTTKLLSFCTLWWKCSSSYAFQTGMELMKYLILIV
jgi:hypothetical protein